MLNINQGLLDRLTLRSRDHWPKEHGGILTGQITVERMFPLTNTSLNPFRFAPDPTEVVNTLLQIEKEDLLPVASYHSHPSYDDTRKNPSKEDLDPRTNNALGIIGPILVIATPLDVWAFRSNALTMKGIKINGRWGGTP